MEPDSIIKRQSQQSKNQNSSSHSKEQQNIKERLLNALKEIASLEKIIEEKNTQLAAASEEKDRVAQSLAKSHEENKKLYDKLAEVDILRNMEITEQREAVEKVIAERDRLLNEKEELIEDVFAENKLIDSLKIALDEKELQCQAVQSSLNAMTNTLKEIESRYKEQEINYKNIEQEKNDLKERLNIAVNEIETSGQGPGMEKIISERDHLLKEKEEFIKDAFEKTEIINELKNVVEEKELQYQEAQASLNETSNALRELESKHSELDKKCKSIEMEKDNLRESLKIASPESTYEGEAKAEYLNKIEEFNKQIADAKTAVYEKENEKIFLKNEITTLEKNLQSKCQEIENLNAQNNADIKKLTLEIERFVFDKTELETTIKNMSEEAERHRSAYRNELSAKEKAIADFKKQRDKDLIDYQAKIEELTAERDRLSSRLMEAAKELTQVKKEIEKTEEITKEKKVEELPLSKEAMFTEPVTPKVEKMVYIESSKFVGIKIAAGIILLLILVLVWLVFTK